MLEAPREMARENSKGKRPRPDVLIRVGSHAFAVEWKRSGSLGQVTYAADRARHAAKGFGESAIPLVAVPYMGEEGRSLCARLNVAWLDLSGNAHIVGPGLRIQITGEPNAFPRKGRPETAFSPKASRVARWLLIRPKLNMTQREIAFATGLDEGHTSRVVRKLIDEGLVLREGKGVRASDPDLLLEAWYGQYQFEKHTIIRGHVAARTGIELVRKVSQTLGERQVSYAVTGLSAAWLLTHQAGFRLGTIYLSEVPSPSLFDDLFFREESRGANTWLVIPNDQGVFQGSREREGVQCVHPVQAYLDLKGQPERAPEAATELRAQLLRWNDDG